MKKLIWSYFSLLLLLASCSTTKSLSEGDVLYTGSRIQIKKANSDEEDWKIKESAKKISHLYLELWDTPNGALFGLPRFQVMPTKLWIYNIFYTKKDKKFARWMRRNFGEPPITIQQVNPASKIAKAVNLYENFGHFGTTGNYYLKYNKRKNKAYVRYELMVTKPYLYRFIKYKIDSSHSTINDSFLEYKSVSKIKPEDEFNLDIIKNEKIDLWRYLQNDGFYYLKPDNIIVDADTTVGHKKMDMQFSIEDGLSDKVYERQKIDQFNITIDSIDQKNVDDKFYHWSYGKIRKNLLNGVVSVKKDKNYSLLNTRKSLRNLADLGVFSNPGFSYTSAGIDSLRLNANLNLETLDASSVGFNLRGNYKNVGYIGPSIGVSFKQLNVFRGAENLSVEVDAYYDFPFGAFKERKSNSSGFSFRSQLSAPLLKAPFNFVKSTYALPKQSVALNLDYNNRIDYFTIVSWNTSYGFTWKSKPNITHQLNLINATYSDILNSTSRFDSLVVDNPSLRTSLVDQFILGSSYTINIDNRYNENTRIGTYFQGSVELSGNLLNLLNGVITNIEEGNRKFLGVKYAQFARFNYDFRTYWRTGLNSKLVFRHLGGIGISYGNSDQMPYIKQFIIGGSNSLRPIVSRAAGPGRYIELNQAEVNQVGDLKLEWNLEYRFRLFWKLEGAIWSDAGNIWLLKEDPNRPRSGVRWGHIFEDSYLTSGLGLRLDLDFMILRVDYGAVLYVPLLGKGLNWIWQNKLPLWHPVIGFGYPF